MVEEVVAAAGHLGPVAWEAGLVADAAIAAVASCATSLANLDAIEAEQNAFDVQEAVVTSQKTNEAAMAALAAVSIMESFFEAKEAGQPEAPSIHKVGLDSLAAIEVAEKAFEMRREEEGEDFLDEAEADDCGAGAEAAVAGVCDVVAKGPVCVEGGKKVYAADAAPRGLVAHFSFNDAQGLDSSGRHNHATKPPQFFCHQRLIQIRRGHLGQGHTALIPQEPSERDLQL